MVAATASQVIVKIVAQGEHWTNFFTDRSEGNFNSFDFVVVVVSYAMLGSDGSMIAVCRLLRLVKVMVWFFNARAQRPIPQTPKTRRAAPSRRRPSSPRRPDDARPDQPTTVVRRVRS